MPAPEGFAHCDADQELRARVTGGYRRGVERTAKDHPRESGR